MNQLVSGKRRVASRVKLVVISIGVLALAGCMTTEYVIDQGSGVDGDVYRDYDILGYVTTEIAQRERITSNAFADEELEFSFTGFRQNLLAEARTQYPNADDVIRVVITPTFTLNSFNFLGLFTSDTYSGRIYHVEGVAIQYR